MLGHHIAKLAQRKFYPFDQGRSLCARVICRRVQRALEGVINRQQIACEAGATVLLGLAAVTVGPFARVLGVGEGAHEAITKLITFGAQHFDFFKGGVLVGYLDFVGALVFLRHGRLPCLSLRP